MHNKKFITVITEDQNITTIYVKVLNRSNTMCYTVLTPAKIRVLHATVLLLSESIPFSNEPE